MAEKSLIDHLVERAWKLGHDDRLFVAFDKESNLLAELSANDLLVWADSVAEQLRRTLPTGSRVLLPIAGALDFHIGFIACRLAGVVAVPTPQPVKPMPGRTSSAGMARINSIAASCLASAVLLPVPAGADNIDHAARIDDIGDPGANIATVRIGNPRDRATGRSVEDIYEASRHHLEPIALLQYTSGSTTDPKGVIVPEEKLVRNQRLLSQRLDVRPHSRIVSWLPNFHDLGLCIGVVLPIVSGSSAWSTLPKDFITNPLSWLKLISGGDDVVTAAPDFAYRLVARHLERHTELDLDLSGWRVGINGAESVRADTLRRIHSAAEGYGLRRNVVRPAYGLAEATLVVSISGALEEPVTRTFDRAALARGEASQAAGDPAGVELVGNGSALEPDSIAVVEPGSSRRVADSRIGEVWVRSASVCPGYWNHPEATAASFEAVPAEDPDTRYMATGDLGFMAGGELFVVGRLKDVINVRGENVFPDDIESVATAGAPALDGARAAAWQVFGGAERVFVAVEFPNDIESAEVDSLVRTVAKDVATVLSTAFMVLAVERNSIPHTTSGKVRRQSCEGTFTEKPALVIARRKVG